MKFGFRVDAGDQVGFGHFFRALALGSSLRDLGHDVSFITHDTPLWAASLAASESIAVVRLKNGESLEFEIGEPNTFNLSTDDAARTVSASKRLELDLLIFDHYGIGQEWVDEVSSSGVKLMQIADDRAIDGLDWVLDYGFDASLEKHGLDTKLETKSLLGPTYAALPSRQPKALVRGYAQSKDTKPLALVALGSAVPADVLDGIADAYRSNSRRFDMCIVSNTKSENERLGPGLTWLSQVDGLAHLLAQASFAVTSGGVTMYERIAWGVPGVAIKTAENQSPAFRQLVSEGLGTDTFLDLGDLVADHLLEQIATAVDGESSEQRCLLQSKLDLRGSMRVALALTDSYDKALMTVRHHESRDAPLLLRWANDSYARSMSLKSGKIMPAEHLAWLAKAEIQKVQILIFEYRGVPCGQVRFEPTKTGTIISYMLDQFFRGKGLSNQMIELALETAAIGDEVTALIKHSNSRSRVVLEQHGFLLDSTKKNYIVLKLLNA